MCDFQSMPLETNTCRDLLLALLFRLRPPSPLPTASHPLQSNPTLHHSAHPSPLYFFQPPADLDEGVCLPSLPCEQP